MIQQVPQTSEDLGDMPTPTRGDDGNVLTYDRQARAYVLKPPPKAERRGGVLSYIAGNPGPTRLRDLDDVSGTPSGATDGYAYLYDSALDTFVLGEVSTSSTIAGAEDFGGTTGPGTDGYTINWDNDAGEFVLTAPVEDTNTTTIADATDLGTTPGAGTDGYALTWDNGAGEFVLSEVSGGGGGTPGGSTTQVQYNSSGSFAGHSGFTYDGSGTATLSTALVAPVIKPASDSTTAVKITNAAGSTDVLTVDTTNEQAVMNLLKIESDWDGTYPQTSGLVLKSNALASGASGITRDGNSVAYLSAGAATNGHVFYVAGTERMRITGSELSIDSSLSVSLDVLEIESDWDGTYPQTSGLVLKSNASASGASGITRDGNSVAYLSAGAATNGHVFYVAGTERMRITGSELSIDSSLSVSLPTLAIESDWDDAFPQTTGLVLKSNASGANSSGITRDGNSVAYFSASGGDNGHIFYVGGTEVARIKANTLDVAGLLQANSLRIDQTPTNETITPTHTITISVDGTDYKIPIEAA